MRRRQRYAATAGFCARRQLSAATVCFWATVKDRVDVDLGVDYAGDVELDDDFDVVVQLDGVVIWLDVDAVPVG